MSNTTALTPPPGTQRIIPYLAYRDAPRAIEFLTRAFGFVERFRYPMPDGRLGHVEMSYEGNVLMFASEFEAFAQSPLSQPSVTAQIFCYVDDADAHFARARDAGATIASEPANEHGMRRYRALDTEGHPWIFATVTDETG